MKYKFTYIPLYFISSAILATSAFSTESITVVGGGGDYLTRVAIPSGDYNVILESPESTAYDGTMFKGNGSTITSLDAATNTPPPEGLKWSFTGDLTIDINSDSDGNVTALNNSGNTIGWNLGTRTIKNSKGGESTFADINVGTSVRFSVNRPSTEKSNLIIGTNANITGEMLTFASNAGGGYAINGGITVNHSVTNTYFGSGAILSIGENSVLDASNAGNFAFYNGSSASIASGATFKLSKTTIEKNTAFAVNGTLEYTYTSEITLYNIDISGGSVISKNLTPGTNARIKISGNSYISGGGTIYINGALDITGGGTFNVSEDSGKIELTDVVIDSSDEIYEGRVFISNGSTLVLNKENAFKRISTYGSTTNSNLLIVGSGNTLELNAANKFKQLYYSGTGDLTIRLSDNPQNTLFFESFNGVNGTYELNIENFSNNMVFFVTTNNLNSLEITAKSSDGTVYTEDMLKFVEGNYSDGTQGYWLNAVPEPAEWASILGFIVLAFAAKRRLHRK